MITGDPSLGKSVEPGNTIGKDGVIQQGTPSGPPHEGSRETYEGRIISVPRDYCWTPCGAGKVLIGYKIWAFQREATNLADSVTQASLRSHVKGSIVTRCYGDDAGTLGGFVSGTHNSWCTPKTWSETVTFEGRNAVRDSDEWWMNRFNTWGVLDYKNGAEQPSNSSSVDGIEPKLWLAQEGARAETGTGRGAERDSLFPAPPGMESWDWSPAQPTYQPYDPRFEPNEPANNNVPPTSTLVNPAPPPPLLGPQTSIGPIPLAQPALKSNVVTVKGQRYNCNCLIGEYSAILAACKLCKNQTHHMAPDMIYRVDKRPTNQGQKGSLFDRIPGAPTFNEGMSICISSSEHTRLHQNLTDDLNRIGSNSKYNQGNPGTAPLALIYRYVRSSVMNIKGVNYDCLQDAKKQLNDQTQFMPTQQPGRTQSNLPLDPGSSDVLQRGFY